MQKVIVFEAESLEKAKEKINDQLLKTGLYQISENIITENKTVKIVVEAKPRQKVDYNSINRPVLGWENNEFVGENKIWVEILKAENKAACTWFKAQNTVNLDHLSPEIGAEYFTIWSRQASKDGVLMEAWAGWHQVLRFASMINDEYKITEACLELGKIYKERGEMIEGGKYWEIAQLFFLHLAYLLKKQGEKKDYGQALWHLGEICLLLDNEPLCKQFWLEAIMIFQIESPTEVLKIEKALQTQL